MNGTNGSLRVWSVTMAVAISAWLTASCPAQMDEAWELWRTGQIPEAEAAAATLIDKDETDNAARHLLVLTCFVDGRYQQGLGHYGQLDPDYERLRELDKLVLDVYQAMGRFDLAINFARQSEQPSEVIKWLETQRHRPLQVHLSKTTVVPFDQQQMIRDMMPAIPININGRDCLGHLDTGGSYIAMSPKMAAELGLETFYIGQGRANAQATDIEAGIVENLKIGAATLENVPTVALSALQGALRMNGRIEDLIILGTNVLDKFLTTWDNENQRLILSPRFDPEAREQHFAEYLSDDAQTMKFFMVPDHYLIGQGRIGNQRAAFFVDTGLVMMGPGGRQPALTTSQARLGRFGLAEDITSASFVEMPPILLGSTEIPNLLARVNPGKVGAFGFAGIELDALLAHGFLKHCVWTLDFDTRQFHLHRFRVPDPPDNAAAAPANRADAGEMQGAGATEADADLQPYPGSYKSEAIQSEIQVSASGTSLSLAATGNLRGTFSLNPTGEHEFEAVGAPVKITIKFEVEEGIAARAEVTVGEQGPFGFEREQ